MKRILPGSFIDLLFISATNIRASKKLDTIIRRTTLDRMETTDRKSAPFSHSAEPSWVFRLPILPIVFCATEAEYGDFALEMEVLIDDTIMNSGIQFRSHFDKSGNNGAGKVYGYQYELDPSARRWSGGIYDEARREWLYPLSLNPKAQSRIPFKRFQQGQNRMYRK